MYPPIRIIAGSLRGGRGLRLIRRLLPVVQLGQKPFHVGPHLRRGKGVRGHMLGAEVDQRVHGFVGERPVRIAPFAVFLVQRSVRLPADVFVLQGHAAALADQLPGRAQERVDRYIEQPGQQLQRVRIGNGFSRFPHLKILVMYECLRQLA